MKKLIFALSLLCASAVYAESELPRIVDPEIPNPEELGDIPGTYDLPEGQFMIELPMMCTDHSQDLFNILNEQHYAMVFLGQTESMAGSDLYVSVFLNKTKNNYIVLLTNKDSGGVCQLTSGAYGQVFPLDEMGI